jgi:hypothetical protein
MLIGGGKVGAAGVVVIPFEPSATSFGRWGSGLVCEGIAKGASLTLGVVGGGTVRGIVDVAMRDSGAAGGFSGGAVVASRLSEGAGAGLMLIGGGKVRAAGIVVIPLEP